MTVKKLITLSLLTAVSLCLFIIEAQIPPLTPFPGIKPGLANIITMFIIYRDEFTLRDAFLALIARVILSALIVGNLFALIFSLTGGILAILAMFGAYKIFKKDKKSFAVPVTGVAGGVFHNIGQVFAATFFYGANALFYAPVLILGGIIAGLLTGFAALLISTRFKTRLY